MRLGADRRSFDKVRAEAAGAVTVRMHILKKEKSMMELETINRNIDRATKQLYTEELHSLTMLYEKNAAELRSIEKQELGRRSIQLPLKAQDAVKAVLREAEVSRINMVWQGISEQLPSFAYTYIDWNSLDGMKQKEYRREISDTDYQKAKKGMIFPVVCGCLAVGSIALVCLLANGNPLKKVFTFISVVSVLAGGVAIVRALTEKSHETDKNNPEERENSTNGQEKAIAAAKLENEKILRDWCSRAGEISKREIMISKREIMA